MTDTRPGWPSETTRSNATRSASSSGPRPMNGVISGRRRSVSRRQADEASDIAAVRLVRQVLGHGRRPNEPLCLGREQHVVWRCARREAGGRLERSSGDRRPVRFVRGCQHLAGREADTEPRVGRDARHRIGPELESRPDGAHRVVLASDGKPEDGGHAAGICVIDGPAMALHGAANGRDGSPLVCLDDLGVELILAGGWSHIRAEHGDDAPGSATGGFGSGDGRRRGRPPRSGRRRSRQLLGQDRPLELLQLRTRIETELVGEMAPGILIRLERLPLAAIGIQRQHQQTPHPLASWLVPKLATAVHRSRLDPSPSRSATRATPRSPGCAVPRGDPPLDERTAHPPGQPGLVPTRGSAPSRVRPARHRASRLPLPRARREGASRTERHRARHRRRPVGSPTGTRSAGRHRDRAPAGSGRHRPGSSWSR